jgi:hypothetical protein
MRNSKAQKYSLEDVAKSEYTFVRMVKLRMKLIHEDETTGRVWVRRRRTSLVNDFFFLAKGRTPLIFSFSPSFAFFDKGIL